MSCGEKIRRSQIVVVAVQAIGDAAKSTERSRPSMIRDSIPFRARAQLRRGRTVFRKASSSFVDRPFPALRALVRAAPSPAISKTEPRISDCCVTADVQRDLLFVDEFLVQPARLPAAQNRRREIGVRIAGLEDRRRQPRHVDARQLHVVLDDRAPLRGDRRRLRRDLRHGARRASAAQNISPRALSACAGSKSPDNRQARVVRRVVELEEIAHVLELRRLNVRVRADDVARSTDGPLGRAGETRLLRRCRTGVFSMLWRRSLRTTSCWFERLA